MKQISLIFTILIIALVGCGTEEENSPTSDKADVLVYEGQTSQGTEIIDTEESEFDIDAVSMISTPDSSCFSQIGYDNEYHILVVTFKDSGDTYLYLDFSSSDWKAFKNADSLGSYYNQNIKGNYECNKWD